MPASARAAERLIMLTPIVPAPTGNGLAMRAELFRRSAAREFDVQTVVVPVAGQLPRSVPAPPQTIVVPPDGAVARAGLPRLIADAAWRDRLARVGRLPGLARAASPGLAGAVVKALGPAPSAGVHVMRSYLAPLGLAVAERIGAPWITLDLDEDDAKLSSAGGDPEEAEAYNRLLSVFAGRFDGIAASSGAEAAALGQRHGVEVEPLPNAVELPRDRRLRRAGGPGLSMLFVGNLNYRPNIEAVSLLAETILPEVGRRVGDVHLTLAGPYGPVLDGLAGPHVTLTGFVPDLGPVYAGADVVVVPLLNGAGTRIKLLEAFAHEVPVVASAVAAAGLMVIDGRHLLLAEDAAGFAAAIERMSSSRSFAGRLAHEARQLVVDHYCAVAVEPLIERFFRPGPATRRSIP